jgi:hypothetical protein
MVSRFADCVRQIAGEVERELAPVASAGERQ